MEGFPCKVYQKQLLTEACGILAKRTGHKALLGQRGFHDNWLSEETQNLDLKSNLNTWTDFSQSITYLTVLGALVINFCPFRGFPATGSSAPGQSSSRFLRHCPVEGMFIPFYAQPILKEEVLKSHDYNQMSMNLSSCHSPQPTFTQVKTNYILTSIPQPCIVRWFCSLSALPVSLRVSFQARFGFLTTHWNQEETRQYLWVLKSWLFFSKHNV